MEEQTQIKFNTGLSNGTAGAEDCFSTFSNSGKSSAYRVIGPSAKYSSNSSSKQSGTCPEIINRFLYILSLW